MSCEHSQKFNCSKCNRAAFVVVENGISVRHQHGGEKHDTLITIDDLKRLLIGKGFVILGLEEIAAKFAR